MAAPRPAACVMGWPVKHSRAPIIHGYWIEQRQRVEQALRTP